VLSTSFKHPIEQRPLRVALILWSGYIGGAESLTADLARAMQALGAAPAVLFILEGVPLADRLDRFCVPHSSLGLQRGREVLRARRRLAKAVLARSPDAVILVEPGYLAAALRNGGYSGPIIGIEHGSLLQLHTLNPLRRLIRTADRMSGARACSVVVAVSEYVRDRVNARRPRRRVVCIPNGVDLERFSPSGEGASPRSGDEIVIGCASRLIEGKGIEDVIQALACPSLDRARLRIAGTGPHQEALKRLAGLLSVDTRTEFIGAVVDMPAFWRSVDVAVVPSNRLVESFGMVAVEAMACGKPVVASENGALPSIVVEGETGRIVPASDIVALANAVSEYAKNPRRRARDGSNGRLRCEDRFGIERTASRYLELCTELVRGAAERP
jgi:glycosyltransferase involved in cell wall biosynthesis